MSQYKMVVPPSITAGAAYYPYDATLAKRFTAVSRFDDTYYLYRKSGNWILLPREVCPIGTVDKRSVGIPFEFKSSFEPRNVSQARVAAESTELLLQGRNHIVEAPTGWGKTVVGVEIIGRMNTKTLVIVHKQDIAEGWVKTFRSVLGIPGNQIGFIGDGYFQTQGCQVVVGMVQTLMKGAYGWEKFTDFGMTLWDEVHRMGADVFSNTAYLFPGMHRLGMSATPYRKDGKEALFLTNIGTVDVRTTMKKLTPKILIQHSSWHAPHWLKVEPGRTMKLNKYLAQDHNRNHMIASFVLTAYNKGRNTIVFADTIAHLEVLFEAAGAIGVPYKDMAYYIGSMNKEERNKAKGKNVIFATYKMASEGTDIPWLDTLVMASPRSDVKQIIGRILREYEDKKPPVVFDVVDNSNWIFRKYAENRRFFYQSIKAPVKTMNY